MAVRFLSLYSVLGNYTNLRSLSAPSTLCLDLFVIQTQSGSTSIGKYEVEVVRLRYLRFRSETVRA